MTRTQPLDTPAAGTASGAALPADSLSDELDTQLTRTTRIHHLAELKAEGIAWPMLTAYDYSTARIFQQAGIPVLLVGDSAANVVYGYDTTVPVSTEEMIPLIRAVVRGAPKALVVADLVFGSYELSPEQAVETAVMIMKQTGCHAVKIEGGVRMVPQIRALVAAGIPVMGHIGFTPQSVNGLGGFRVQGRGAGAGQLTEDASAVEAAGAFSVVLEMVPGELATEVTRSLSIPTIGIGAGSGCDAQVLVWQDMAGYTDGPPKRFVRKYTELGASLRSAASNFAEDVRDRSFPDVEHTFADT